MILGARAAYIPENSPGGARCAVKALAGELRSDCEVGTDSPTMMVKRVSAGTAIVV